MKRILLILVFSFALNCSFANNTILVNLRADQFHYIWAVVERIALGEISDETFDLMIRQKLQESRFGFSIRFRIYGISEFQIFQNTKLTVNEVAKICNSIIKQDRYPWLLLGTQFLPRVPYEKSFFAEELQMKKNSSMIYAATFTTLFYDEVYHKFDHKCILRTLDRLPTRQELMDDLEDYINTYLSENKDDIEKYGIITPDEYEKYFSKEFLEQQKCEKPIVEISL